MRTVRVTRDDGSVTFKGWYSLTRGLRGRYSAERERDAWLEAGYDAEVVDSDDPAVAAELKAWKMATKDGGRYRPQVEVTR